MIRSLACFLLSASLAFADAPVSPGEDPQTREVNAKPGQLATLNADAACSWSLASEVSLLWYPGDTFCRVVVPSDMKSGRIIFVASPKAGGPAVRYVLVVSGELPPEPPEPKPTELAVKLKAAFVKDGSPKAAAKELAAFYRAAVAFANDKEIETADELVTMLRSAIEKKPELAGKLMEVRKVMSAELLAALKDPKAAFTDATRKATAVLFGDAAVVMEELGK